ncbi:MAG TPA: S8 family serine peptidase [Gemmatimonadales bacterium]|nr:S8 family serine peptidase [Gemmatimonadales bacterium]
MKRPVPLPLALLGALALAACAEDWSAPNATHPESAPRPGLAAAAADRAPGHFVTFRGNSIPDGFAAEVAALGGTVERAYDRIGVAFVSGLDDAAAGSLRGKHGVTQVDPNPVIALEQPALSEPELASVESPAAPATAFFFARQWHLRAVGADRAWAAGRLGSPAVRVAILDTGIDYTHADLVGRVDMARSRSFVPGDAALVATHFPGRPDWIDLHFHGTHVGATVASNALAAAGVTSQVTLIAVKVLGANGFSQGNSVLDGIMYAATPISEGGAGADVINMSLGGSFLKRDFPGAVAVINRAINYAHRQGVTVVVSAGNSAIDLDHDGNSYKTYCNSPTVVCVAATGPTAQGGTNGPWTNIDAPASYTNYGRSAINVAAPGGNAASFVWAACSRFSLAIPICRTGTFILGAQGTSMAAPHTSGLAALLVEDLGRRPGQIRAALQQSADDLGEPGTDPFYGKGRINVAAALGL